MQRGECGEGCNDVCAQRHKGKYKLIQIINKIIGKPGWLLMNLVMIVL